MDAEQNKPPSVAFPHDTSYRYLLSSKKLFVELLRSFVVREWVAEMDESDLETIDHSFVLPDFKRKEADLVYRLRMKEGEIIFYVLMELQSTVDPSMPYRLLLYQAEIWRYLLRNRAASQGEGFSLPVIVPIVLYNGQKPWTAARRLRTLMPGERAFGSELLDFEYILIDVERYTEEELLSLSNTIGAVFLLDQTADREQLLARLRKLMGIVRAMSEDMQSQFVNWLANIVSLRLPPHAPEVGALIEDLKDKEDGMMGLLQNLDAIRRSAMEEGIQLGKEQGMEQGLEQGLEQAALRMIRLGLGDEVILQATGISGARLRELQRLASAP